MESYIYLCFSEYVNARIIEAKLRDYASALGVEVTAKYEEAPDKNIEWEDRYLGRLFDHVLKPNDQLVVYEAANLGRSVSSVIDVLLIAMQKGVTVHFVRSKYVFSPKKCHETRLLLAFCKEVGQQFGSRKTLDDISRKNNSLKPVGRPPGKQNRTLKLDEHRSDIMRYLNLKVSKSSIARLLNCHPQTLQDWINRYKILEKQ